MKEFTPDSTFIFKLIEITSLPLFIIFCPIKTVTDIAIYFVSIYYFLLGMSGILVLTIKANTFYDDILKRTLGKYLDKDKVFIRTTAQRLLGLLASAAIVILMFGQGYQIPSFLYLFGNIIEDCSEDKFVSLIKIANREVKLKRWI